MNNSRYKNQKLFFSLHREKYDKLRADIEAYLKDNPRAKSRDIYKIFGAGYKNLDSFTNMLRNKRIRIRDIKKHL